MPELGDGGGSAYRLRWCAGCVSIDVDLETGESEQTNDDESFVGLQIESETVE